MNVGFSTVSCINYKYQQKGNFLDILYSKGSYRINKIVIIKQLTDGFGKSDG